MIDVSRGSDRLAALKGIRPGWRGRTSRKRRLRMLQQQRDKEIQRAVMAQADERIEAASEGRDPHRVKPRRARLDRAIQRLRTKIHNDE